MLDANQVGKAVKALYAYIASKQDKSKLLDDDTILQLTVVVSRTPQQARTKPIPMYASSSVFWCCCSVALLLQTVTDEPCLLFGFVSVKYPTAYTMKTATFA